jgi:Ca2+-binding RTX toxin-like protein
MYGGTGHDRYYVVDVNDQVFENADEGYDTVYSSVSFTLAAGQAIEVLYLTDTADINATGNELNNDLRGNAGANILSGGDGDDWLDGGAGADQMHGEAGNDIYVVDDVNDQVFENADEGIDFVYSSISFSLAGHEIERLYLAGSADINATGNELNNDLYGNAGANILDGGGGNDTLHGWVGADQMYGGTGNDTYVVDDVNDQVFENADEGYDTVYSSVSFTLAAGQAIEALYLTDTADINATGNELNNDLRGNAGANILDGREGADTLFGGVGNDIFVFTAAVTAANADMISYFMSGADQIHLDNAVMASLGATGGLNALMFVSGVGAVALDGDDHIIYDTGSGQLLYDADGNGAGAAVLIATLTGAPSLAASDIYVI